MSKITLLRVSVGIRVVLERIYSVHQPSLSELVLDSVAQKQTWVSRLTSGGWQHREYQTPILLQMHWKISRNCQTKLCQKSGKWSKIYRNPASNKPRKMKLLHSWKVLEVLIPLWPHLFPNLAMILKVTAYVPCVRHWDSWIQRKWSTLHQIIVWVCLKLSWGFLEDGCQVLNSISPNSEISAYNSGGHCSRPV